MRKKILVNVLLVFAILAVVLGSTAVIAYMFRQSQVEENLLVPAEVKCIVNEEFSGTSKTSITVKNDGNIAAYIRVRLVTYWINENGNVAPKNSPGLTVPYDDSKWIKGSDNTFYYIAPVPAGNSTLDLLKTDQSIVLAENTDDNTKQVIDVFAEAIQAEPTGAVTSSWGVTINDSGEITKAP